MAEAEERSPSPEPDDDFRRLMIRLAWGHTAFFAALAAAATWFRGPGPEVILGWVALVLLCALMLVTAYGYRKTLVGAGALLLAALFLGASFLRGDDWAVGAGTFRNWAIGCAAFGIGVLAYDAKRGATAPVIAKGAAMLALAGLFAYGFVLHEYGLGVVTAPKMVIGLAVTVALAGLAGKPWKGPLAIAALFPIIIFFFKFTEAGLLF